MLMSYIMEHVFHLQGIGGWCRKEAAPENPQVKHRQPALQQLIDQIKTAPWLC